MLAKHYVANAGRSSLDAYVTLERTDERQVIYAGWRGEDCVVELSTRAVGASPRPAEDSDQRGVRMRVAEPSDARRTEIAMGVAVAIGE